MASFVIDAFEFCRLKGYSEGRVAVMDLPRLALESLDGSGEVSWALRGEDDKQGHPQLKLTVTAKVRLKCQRCLGDFDFDIRSDSVLVLAKNEGEADEIEALLADEQMDVIVGSHAMDIHQVIEDDVLLALPLSPKHESCPANFSTETGVGQERISPFAVLKKLRQ